MKQIFILFAFFLPVFAFAADGFVPLAAIPGLDNTDAYKDLPTYLNSVFNFVISIAAILAVIMIIYHGIQYMVQEAVPEHKDAIVGIRNAVLGLVLLLLSWIILFVINPDILNLKALESSLSKAPTPAQTSLPRTDRAAPNSNATDVVTPGTLTTGAQTPSPSTETVTQNGSPVISVPTDPSENLTPWNIGQ